MVLSLVLTLSFAVAGEPDATAPAATPTETAAPAAPPAPATAVAAPACATVTTNADGTTTLSDATLPACGPDGQPVPAEAKGKKSLKKSNSGRMEAEETRE